MPAQPPLATVIVGASLAGCMSALALARRGIDVTQLERSTPLHRTGASLGGIDEDAVERVTGVRLSGRGGKSGRLPHSWTLVHDQLLAAIDANPRIQLHPDARVESVGQDSARTWATTRDGRTFFGDALIGADGHRSIVRAAIAPQHPNATFAGYVLWLGVAEERSVDWSGRWPSDVDILTGSGDYLIGYPLPAVDGSLGTGTRRLGWAWYDATRNDLLRTTGSVRGTVVQHSLTSTDIPASTYQELSVQARQQWPSPWREAILESITHREVTGTPITEYVPDRLVHGRLAIVGDAAHVPTPMTGSGFSSSLSDAATLAALLGETGPGDVMGAFTRFELARLANARQSVQAGQGFSRAFARSH